MSFKLNSAILLTVRALQIMLINTTLFNTTDISLVLIHIYLAYRHEILLQKIAILYEKIKQDIKEILYMQKCVTFYYICIMQVHFYSKFRISICTVLLLLLFFFFKDCMVNHGSKQNLIYWQKDQGTMLEERLTKRWDSRGCIPTYNRKYL